MNKTVLAIIGLVVAVPAAVAEGPAAWRALGLPDATKVWTLAQVQPLTKTVNELILLQLQDHLYQAKKDQTEKPSPTVDQRVQQLEMEIKRATAKTE